MKSTQLKHNQILDELKHQDRPTQSGPEIRILTYTLVNDRSGLVGSLRKMLPEQQDFTANKEEEKGKKIYDYLFRLSSSGTVCGKDIISTARDLIFFFSMMAPKKVRHPTPSREAEAGHLPQPQHEERSPTHNAVDARPLHAAGAPLPEDRVLSNSPDPSGESLNSPVTRAKFHALMEMIKSLQ
ncbi:hypothetical protein ACLOJK_004198 [Asimina triloba]